MLKYSLLITKIVILRTWLCLFNGLDMEMVYQRFGQTKNGVIILLAIIPNEIC